MRVAPRCVAEHRQKPGTASRFARAGGCRRRLEQSGAATRKPPDGVTLYHTSKGKHVPAPVAVAHGFARNAGAPVAVLATSEHTLREKPPTTHAETPILASIHAVAESLLTTLLSVSNRSDHPSPPVRPYTAPPLSGSEWDECRRPTRPSTPAELQTMHEGFFAEDSSL